MTEFNLVLKKKTDDRINSILEEIRKFVMRLLLVVKILLLYMS